MFWKGGEGLLQRFVLRMMKFSMPSTWRAMMAFLPSSDSRKARLTSESMNPFSVKNCGGVGVLEEVEGGLEVGISVGKVCANLVTRKVFLCRFVQAVGQLVGEAVAVVGCSSTSRWRCTSVCRCRRHSRGCSQ